MVCARCIMVVKELFHNLEIKDVDVRLGMALLKQGVILSSRQQEQIRMELKRLGFDWLEDKNEQLIESIKVEIIDLVHNQYAHLKVNLSDYLVEKLNRDYVSLSSLFSKSENQSIEKYYIQQKIEKVKEYLVYNEFTISEIAHLLHYSSTAHLSNQFKQITGQTPTAFKRDKRQSRTPLEQL